MLATIRDGAEEYRVDLGDLDRDIRMGLASPTAELLHPPWTGHRFLPLRAIPALQDAFDTPDARFAAWMVSRRWPRISPVVTAVIVLAGLAQTAARSRPALKLLSEDAVRRGAVGFEPTLVIGQWWTPWTSQLLHDPHKPLLHLLANLPLLAYCGYRVERALGPAGYLVVAAVSVAVGAAAVITLSPQPVVGSSMLGFGLWAAQIAIGFRMGHAIPQRYRAFYGWGTWVLFAPMYLLNLLATGVSHLGHLGGALGGFLAVAALRPESCAPANQERRAQRRNLGLAAAGVAASFALCAALARSPAMAGWPWVPQEIPEVGARLEVPERMARVEVLEKVAFVPSPGSSEPVFLDRWECPEDQDAEAIAADWARQLGAPITPVPAGEPWGPGWVPYAFDRRTPEGHHWGLVEQRLRQGVWVLRAGYLILLDGPTDPAPKARFYEALLRTLQAGEPPELAQARALVLASPRSLPRAEGLVRALRRAGLDEEARRACQEHPLDVTLCPSN